MKVGGEVELLILLLIIPLLLRITHIQAKCILIFLDAKLYIAQTCVPLTRYGHVLNKI